MAEQPLAAPRRITLLYPLTALLAGGCLAAALADAGRSGARLGLFGLASVCGVGVAARLSRLDHVQLPPWGGAVVMTAAVVAAPSIGSQKAGGAVLAFAAAVALTALARQRFFTVHAGTDLGATGPDALVRARARRDTRAVHGPETRYARSGDVSIAYQVVGDGPFDLVWTPGALSHLDLTWEDEDRARFFRALASFSRLILFDKRGTGLSDRVAGVADLETRTDDIRAVMDAAGSESAVVCGVSEGGPMALLFAATYPERARALVNYGSLPRFVRGPNFPWREPKHEYLADYEEEARVWGTEENARAWLESQGGEPTAEEVRERARRDRLCISPGALVQLARMNAEIDVRPVLSTIQVPTLVLHRREDHIPIEGARWMAEQIPGARFVELPGGPHMPYYGDWESVVDTIREFVEPICLEAARPYDSVLATVLFTDLVGSTAKAVELGDRRWRELLEQHHARIRAQLSRHRGVELDTAGDGFFARFDGPARAIRCACAIRDVVADLGLEVRAGLHTGECELLDSKVAGITVSIGARVAAQAGPGDVLVSQTVRDLVAGSGIAFEDRGAAELKGVPGTWRLYAVTSAG